MSAREIGALLENRASVVANSLTCTAAVKRLGELKAGNAVAPAEQHYALQTIYRTAYKQNFAPREIARFLHKVALGRLDPELPKFALDKLSEVDDYRVFTPIELSNLAWTFAKYKRRDDVWFEKTERALLGRELDASFTPDHVSNLLWSFALLQHQPSPEVLDRFARQPRTCESFKLQALVNYVWAFAKFGYPNASSDDLGDVFAEAKRRNLGKLRIQSLANLLWAQAELGHADAELTAKIVDTFVRNFTAKDFSPVALENAALGLAKLPRELGKGLEEMLAEAARMNA